LKTVSILHGRRSLLIWKKSMTGEGSRPRGLLKQEKSLWRKLREKNRGKGRIVLREQRKKKLE